MPLPSESYKKEQPSTYVVQDRQNQQEMARLVIQDRLVTHAMGGVLPEQPDAAKFRRVLDVGCGTGGWVIEAARTYPELSLYGIDISQLMIEYAREQAKAQPAADRVEFAVMDALLLLDFPPGYFDLVNLRLGSSFMRTWDWPKLISEMKRVTRREGIIRLTDSEIIHQSNSAALGRLQALVVAALYQAGHLFEADSQGLSAHLTRLLRLHLLRSVQTKGYSLTFRAGTPEGQAYYGDVEHFFRTARPFLQKWTAVPKDYEAIYQQALQEMQQSDFYAVWNLVSVWGTNPDSPRWPRRD